MRAIIVFKEGLAGRYTLPKFQKTLTGEVVGQNATTISIIPLRCSVRKVRNIEKSDLISYEIF